MSETKRRKTSVPTKFEQLPNELLLTCFTYFNFYSLYKTFVGLNQRFNQLLFHQAKLYIDLDEIPEGEFLTFCLTLNHLFSTGKNYPVSINTSHGNRFDLIMKDKLFQEKFSKLKSLTLSEMHTDSVNDAIFRNDETKLYRTLERITLSDISEKDQFGRGVENLCEQFISSKMKVLKYLNITVTPYRCGCENNAQSGESIVDIEFQYLPRQEKSFSQLETLIIGNLPFNGNAYTTTKLSFHTLTKEILPRLPKLKNLTINAIHFDERRNHLLHGMHQSTTSNDAIKLLNLKYIRLWTTVPVRRYNEAQAKENKQLLRNFFLNSKALDGIQIKVFLINDEEVLE